MNDLKTTSVLEKLFHNSTREGQVSLVSTHDVTNPPAHYCNWSLVYFCFQSVDNIHNQVMKSKTLNYTIKIANSENNLSAEIFSSNK